MNEKIRPTHLERKAVVYCRQSTLKQVAEHKESTVRQYALGQRALQLGWLESQVEIIDTDLGWSGSSAEDRSGYLRLAEDVAYGRVGGIFAIEVSRLSRREADWYKLLDVCGLADVVLIDEQSVYSPRDYNDRLLLGLKGTMSEAELMWMKLRMQGAAMSKARRGDLRHSPPAGYEWDAPSKRLVLSPNEQLQASVRLVFQRFRIDGSANAVARYFCSHEIQLGTHDKSTGTMRWAAPGASTILQMLRNPAYAGAYVYGRAELRRALVNGEIRNRQYKALPMEDWKVFLKDWHPRYIELEEFMSNQKKLDSNRGNHEILGQRGASREGAALLQGLLLCGLCGRRMETTYSGRDGKGRYRCGGVLRNLGGNKRCLSVSASTLDGPIVERFLKVAVPDEVDWSLAVANQTEEQVRDITSQWEMRLERARYEARHAERRYRAVDPDNRTVARTLEKDWNDALEQVARIEEEMKEAINRSHLHLTEQDRKRIRDISKNLPLVWESPSTTLAERKNLIRLVIEEISVTPIDLPAPAVRVKILWRGGAVEDFSVERPRTPTDAREPTHELRERVQSFMESHLTDSEIAAALNGACVRTSTKRKWTQKAVERFRERNNLRKRCTTSTSSASPEPTSRDIPPRKGAV